ncbi:Nucleoporin SEH1 [Smittium culicis]|uniref:Nucleoporin SEH1 n=1 Tax=Smittium culicis TaxID=133412 RepID=A0A1R1Y277_9FUNG|nr:Nucleoporin SEH1 [Smittium culicis]
MKEKQLGIDHQDLIHDIEYNYYGTRIATCSSDKKIKVYDWNSETNSWELNDQWRAHNSAVVCISWSHPEYGEILASSSLDRGVRIWIEQKNQRKNSGMRWACGAVLSDSIATVHKISFGPEYMGLTLAAASSDGKVRIYSPSQSINLQNWTISSIINAIPGGATDSDGPLCFSWCDSQLSPFTMAAVGCNKINYIMVFMYIKTRWVYAFEVSKCNSNILSLHWAPQMGRSFHTIVAGFADGFVRIYQIWLNKESDLESESLFYLSPKNGSLIPRVSGLIDANNSLVSDDSDIRHTTLEPSDTVNAPNTTTDHSVLRHSNTFSSTNSDTFPDFNKDSFPPLISSVPSSGTNNTSNINNNKNFNSNILGQSAQPEDYSDISNMFSLARIELVMEENQHNGLPVRKVKSNATGSVLISCGDDGTTKLWKRSFNSKWECNGIISAEE